MRKIKFTSDISIHLTTGKIYDMLDYLPDKRDGLDMVIIRNDIGNLLQWPIYDFIDVTAECRNEIIDDILN